MSAALPIARFLAVILSLSMSSAPTLADAIPTADDGGIRVWLDRPEQHAVSPPDATDRWRPPPKDAPDWAGARRDTAYFLAHQFVAIGLLYIAPESISGWSDEQKRNYSFKQWRDNVKAPVWDDDLWWINYVLHPYWGAAYYIRGREQGLDQAQAFWFSALLSTLFEFGAEALAEPVSKQDLLVTPIVGSLLGEYVFAPMRQRIRDRPGALTWSDKALLVLTDPLGVVNDESDRLLGRNISLRLGYFGTRDAHARGIREAATVESPAWGIRFGLSW